MLGGFIKSPYEGNSLFPPGKNVSVKTVVFGKEELPDGRCCVYVTDYETNPPQVICHFWLKDNPVRAYPGRPRGTGGKPAHFKIYLEKLANMDTKLSDEELGTLMRIAKYADWETNILVHPKTKQPLTTKDIVKLTNCSRRTLYRRLKALQENDVIEITDEGYYRLNPDLVYRGSENKKKK